MVIAAKGLASQVVGQRYSAIETWRDFVERNAERRRQSSYTRNEGVETRRITVPATKSPQKGYGETSLRNVVTFKPPFLRELNNTSTHVPDITSFNQVTELLSLISPEERMRTSEREGVMAIALATGNPFIARKLIGRSEENPVYTITDQTIL